MKEQVSVDNLTVTIKASDKVCLTMPGYTQISIDEYKRLKRLEEENSTLKTFIKNACYSEAKESFDFEINIDDIVRLKRLDENVKKNIKMLDEILAKFEECYALHNLDDNDDYNEVSNQKKLLKSLYNENTQES